MGFRLPPEIEAKILAAHAEQVGRGVCPFEPGVSEKAFQGEVIRAAKEFGWKTYHVRDSRKSEAGLPDLLLCRPPRLMFAELKTEIGVVSAAQTTWLELLAACGVVAVVWRPAQWTEIVEALR